MTGIALSASLLEELKLNRGQLPIEVICGDLMHLFEWVAPRSIAVAVCMGDTLTQLESLTTVDRLFAAVAAALIPGGRLGLSWRD